LENHINVIFSILLIALTSVGCNQQVNYKIERDKVIQLHDQVMSDQDRITGNHKKLESLLESLSEIQIDHPELDTLQERDSIKLFISRLTKSEQRMTLWMDEFEPDMTGKSNEDAVAYFLQEQLKIKAVDLSYKKELQATDAYLKKFKLGGS
jgi:hypothetical protein